MLTPMPMPMLTPMLTPMPILMLTPMPMLTFGSQHAIWNYPVYPPYCESVALKLLFLAVLRNQRCLWMESICYFCRGPSHALLKRNAASIFLDSSVKFHCLRYSNNTPTILLQHSNSIPIILQQYSYSTPTVLPQYSNSIPTVIIFQ